MFLRFSIFIWDPPLPKSPATVFWGCRCNTCLYIRHYVGWLRILSGGVIFPRLQMAYGAPCYVAVFYAIVLLLVLLSAFRWADLSLVGTRCSVVIGEAWCVAFLGGSFWSVIAFLSCARPIHRLLFDHSDMFGFRFVFPAAAGVVSELFVGFRLQPSGAYSC